MQIRDKIQHILWAERERWMFWQSLPLGFGVLAYFAFDFEPPNMLMLATPMMAILLWVFYKNLGLWWRGFALGIFLFLLGLNAAQFESRIAYTPMLDDDHGLKLVSGILKKTQETPDGVRVILSNVYIKDTLTQDMPKEVSIKVKRKTLPEIPPSGTKVNIWTSLGSYSEPVLPGAMDFRRQSYFLSLGATGWTNMDVGEMGIEAAHPSLMEDMDLMFERTRRILSAHAHRYLTGDAADLVSSLLNRQQTNIAPDVMEAVRASGLAHLIAPSGFHVTLMGLLVFFPLRWIFSLFTGFAQRHNTKKWAAMGAILSVIAYTLLANAGAATLRSMFMAGLAMMAVMLDREAKPMRLVMVSAIIVMVLDPVSVLSASFQLSFAAVMVLIAVNEREAEDVKEDDKESESDKIWRGIKIFFHYFYVIVRTSILCGLATMPFSIYHFGTVSFYGMLANSLAIPLSSYFVVPNILLAYLAMPLGLDRIFIVMAGWGSDWIIWIAKWVAGLPHAVIYVPAMPSSALAMMVFGGLWLCLWQKKWRFFGLLPIVVGLCYQLYTARPDLLLSPDGKVWAVMMRDGRMAGLLESRHDFVMQQWRLRQGQPALIDVRSLSADNKEMKCDADGCVYYRDNKIIALPTQESALMDDCAKADIVIAPFILNDCMAKMVIDANSFWQGGAHAIYFDKTGAMRIEQSRNRPGARPWNVGWDRAMP